MDSKKILNNRKPKLAPVASWSDENLTLSETSLSIKEPPTDTAPSTSRHHSKGHDTSSVHSITLIPRHSIGSLNIFPDRNNNNPDDDNISNESDNHIVIPDGGWGWVVVFASLIISMIADGISFSFGLLYVEYLEEFKESNSRTSWIGGLFLAVPLLTGPIMSALVDRYGCRSMTIVGGFVSALGFVLSCFSQSVEFMYATFGVIAGLGLGLCYVTAVVSITFWFEKKRNLAVGLGACGTGIGTFVYAPMTQYFIEEYGWRGTNLLLGGTFLYICVAGAVMRDPAWLIKEKIDSKLSNSNSNSHLSGNEHISVNCFDVEHIKSIIKSEKPPELILKSLVTYFDQFNVNDNQNYMPKNHSLINLPTYLKEHEKVPSEVIHSIISNKKLYRVILDNYPNLISLRSLSEHTLNEATTDHQMPLTVNMSFEESAEDEPVNNTQINMTNGNVPAVNKVNKISDQHERHKNFLNKKQISISSHCFRNVRVNRNSLMFKSVPVYSHTRYCLRASSCPNVYRTSMVRLDERNYEEKWYTNVVDFFKGMCDFSMFLNYHFVLFSASTILLFTWFIVPYFYLKEYMSVHGYDENDASDMISISGVASTFGMIGLGWLGDKPWINVKLAYSWCLIACGISIIGMKFAVVNYVLLVCSSIGFGLFFASSFAYTPMILAGLVDFDKFTSAYGLVLLCQGIGNLIGPPLAGGITDYLGSFDMTFYQSGFWIIISGICIWLIDVTENRDFFSSSASS